MSTTFTWAGDDVKDQGPVGTEIRINNISRPVVYPVKRNKVFIPGKDYSWDFGNNEKDDYTISVDITITGTTAALAQECVEELSVFMEGKKALQFSDSSTVHTARIYDVVAATPEGRGNVIRATMTFECGEGN